MAIHNLVTNRITEGIDKPLTNGLWLDVQGLEVEDFISTRLLKAITNLSFSNETSELTGYNSDGEEICKTTVINATPNYVPEIEIVSLRINSNNDSLKTGESIELNQPSIIKMEVGVKLIVKYDILGKTYYGIDPQKVEFKLGNQTYVADKVIPNSASNLEAIQYIDITRLCQVGVNNATLTASCTTKDYSDSDSYDGSITLRKIEISYTNKGYVEGTVVSFNISGINMNDVSKFQLVYYDNGSKDTQDISNNTKVDLELLTGTHLIYARIEHKLDSNSYYSNWIQTNVIVDCNNILGDAVAVINSIPTQIDNCSNALLYKICYAPGTNGGNIVINSYISENYDYIDNEITKHNYKFNSTTLSLTSEDKPGEKEFYSYFELETVSNNDARFIGFDINGETVKSYYGSTPDIDNYFTISIVENPYNIDNAFNHTQGANLNFSQINGSGSNVFDVSNTNVLPGDGWMVDGRYTGYQVSASAQELFKTPINLLSSLNNGFTFEFLLKTYNVNSDDPVIKIGNLYMGPGYVRVNLDLEEGKTHAKNSIHINSKADYGKEEVTHILITYTKQYTPKTYTEIYNLLLNQGSINYSSPDAVTPYNVLKVYVNGVINREIQVTDNDLKRNDQFNLQIAPVSSDLRLYGLRTYEFPFTYAQIQKNYISSLLDSDAKKRFYDKNDILDDFGQISLKKCFNKYNVIVYAIPETDCPLFYGNKNVAGDEGSDTSILVHYANPDWANYNVKMWGGKYKAQGSSAKKYLIHNCQYNIKKGKCLTEAEFEKNLLVGEESPEYTKPRSYYQMPESDIQAKKFVGKVNYASSMQTHKLGACDLFDGAYKSIFQNSLEERMPTGGRKAVVEKEFLYFYYNLKPGETLDTITIKDTLEDAKFIGFQTWGPGKTDDPTYGYSDNTPEYLLLEGADNANAGANFKMPWAAFQTYDSTIADIGTLYIKQLPASVTKTDYVTGLLIDDETIKFSSFDDPLDVDYGVDEYKGHYTDSNKVFAFTDEVRENSLKHFVEFYNNIYLYDFTCYMSMSDVGITTVFDVNNPYSTEKYKDGVTNFKLYCPNSEVTVKDGNLTSTAKRFDVYRWDAVRSKWVPAGLHMNELNTDWEPFNLATKYYEFQSRDLYKKYVSEFDISKFTLSQVRNDNDLINYVFPAMKYMFIATCKEYTDYEDIAYHQAAIRVLSGTDNRAKNTYFQIIGKIYENGEPTEKGDYKIRLMQDDLDTIFATDNNGQQLKPYYLLEPPFNLDLEDMWGDNHSSFFYPFDLCFATKINEYTGLIIDHLIGTSPSITSEATKLHLYFLRILETLPAIAYNHTAEIYYELAQTLWLGGNSKNKFTDLLSGYVNNSVSDPLSLSHGSNYEGEIQFLKDRLVLLASLTGKAPGIQSSEQPLANKGTASAGSTITVSGSAKFLNYFYPNYKTASTNLNLMLSLLNDGFNYDTLFKNPSAFPNASDKIIVQSLAIPGEVYNFSISGPQLTGFVISNIDKYGYLKITEGLLELGSLPKLPRASYLIIDGAATRYEIGSSEITVYEFLPVIENLQLTNTTFTNTILDFRNCNRLKVLDLTGCQGIYSIILPEGNKLKEVHLPACIKSLAITNNPKLETVELESGTNLTSLNLQCDKVGSLNISDLLENYFDFSNAKLLKLTGDCVLSMNVVDRLSSLGSKCDLKGSYTIMDDNSLADISYQMKKNLAKSFGNIDSKSNKCYFNYKHSTLIKSSAVYEELIQGCNFVEGLVNVFYPFDSIYFTQGNDVVIKSDGTLDITYSSNINSAVAHLDSLTGELTLYKNSEIKYNYSVVFNSESAGKLPAITGYIEFGYKEPQVGNYAYADGTFSSSYISNRTLVGIVYAKQTNPTDETKIDLAILSNKTVTGRIAPDFYTYDGEKFNTELTLGLDQLKIYNLLQSSIFIGKTFKPGDDNVTTYEGLSYSPYSVTKNGSLPLKGLSNYQITKSYDTAIFPTSTGKDNTMTYKLVADHHLSLLAIKDSSNFGNYMKNKGYMTAGNQVISNFSSDDYTSICEQFNSRAGKVIPNGGVAQGAVSNYSSYDVIIYPAFYKAAIFQPETEGSLIDAYKAGNWYVPSIDEMSLLIAHRIKSTTTAQQDNDSIDDWYKENTTYTGKGIFTQENKQHFNSFLEDLKDVDNSNFVYITSDVVDFKNVIYTKTKISYLLNSLVGWKASYPYSTHQLGYIYDLDESYSCRRDRIYTVPMCCQITIDKHE